MRQSGERLEIELEGGEVLRVRPKDIELLHPGPLHSLGELVDPAGDLETAWEILSSDDQPHSLAELAELAYGVFSPQTAWAAWRQLEDGLFFSGTPTALRVNSPREVESTRQTRLARAAEAQAWGDFLHRARQGRLVDDLASQGSERGGIPDKELRYLREVEDLAWGHRSDSRTLRELGHAERPEAAHAWLIENGVWDAFVDPYPARAGLASAAPDLPVGAVPDEVRRDLTGLPAYAIDDLGSKDPDDAVSLDGERLWVHVADAAVLAPPDSALDLESRGRGANLYLPEGAVGMLPGGLVQRLGLGLNEVSPALSFGLRLDAYARPVDIEIVPSWVRVQRLTYDQAEDLLVQEPFQGLYRLAQRYRARRLANGAVEINLPEAIVRVVEGRVVIRPVLQLRSRMLVKEAMLMAGEAAASFAIERQLAIPFTCQEALEADLLEELLNRLPGRNLAGAGATEDNDLALAFALRRAQKRSLVRGQPGAHAGLGLPHYSRATSPLRRYADLLAHQQLRAVLCGEQLLDMATMLEHLGEAEAVTGIVSQTESRAVRHWTLVYLLQHPGWQGEGVLVEKRGLRGKVILPELAFEAQVQLRQELPLNSRLPLTLKGVNLAELEAYF